MGPLGRAGVAVALLALVQLAQVVAVLAAGDRTPLRVRSGRAWFDVLGQAVAPAVLALAGAPPVGWHPSVPRDPGVAHRAYDAVAGVTGVTPALLGTLLLPPAASSVALGLLLHAAVPVPGQPGGRLVGAVLPPARRRRWRTLERTVPRPVAPAVALVLVLAGRTLA